MARRKNYEEILRPGASRRGLTHALNHAGYMRRSGLLSQDEANALERYFASELLNSMHGDELDQAMSNGDVDRLQELGGYSDDETDQDEADARRHAAATKVIVHFFADAAQRGIIEVEEALKVLRQYVQVAESDDPGETIDALMDMVRTPAEKAAPEPSADEQIDDYTRRYDKKRTRR
jgi:hypothetical protein